MTRRGNDGIIATELVLAVGLLLLPVVLLVTSLPQWSERQHAAIVAARDAARAAANDWPGDGSLDGQRVATEVVAAHGIPAGDVRVTVAPAPDRGGVLNVTVTIRMPAIAVPLIGRAAAWSWSAHAGVRIDDYRSR